MARVGILSSSRQDLGDSGLWFSEEQGQYLIYRSCMLSPRKRKLTLSVTEMYSGTTEDNSIYTS